MQNSSQDSENWLDAINLFMEAPCSQTEEGPQNFDLVQVSEKPINKRGKKATLLKYYVTDCKLEITILDTLIEKEKRKSERDTKEV